MSYRPVSSTPLRALRSGGERTPAAHAVVPVSVDQLHAADQPPTTHISQRSRAQFAAPPPPLSVICPPIDATLRSLVVKAGRALEAAAQRHAREVLGARPPHSARQSAAPLLLAAPPSATRQLRDDGEDVAWTAEAIPQSAGRSAGTRRAKRTNGVHPDDVGSTRGGALTLRGAAADASPQPVAMAPTTSHAVDRRSPLGGGDDGNSNSAAATPPRSSSAAHLPREDATVVDDAVSSQLFQLHSAMQRFQTSADIALLNLGVGDAQATIVDAQRRQVASDQYAKAASRQRDVVDLLASVTTNSIGELPSVDATTDKRGAAREVSDDDDMWAPMPSSAVPASAHYPSTRGGTSASTKSRPLRAAPTSAVVVRLANGLVADDGLSPASQAGGGRAKHAAEGAAPTRSVVTAGSASLLDVQSAFQDVMRTAALLGSATAATDLALLQHGWSIPAAQPRPPGPGGSAVPHRRRPSQAAPAADGLAAGLSTAMLEGRGVNHALAQQLVTLPSQSAAPAPMHPSVLSDRIERTAHRLRAHCLEGLHAIHDLQDAFNDMAVQLQRSNEAAAATRRTSVVASTAAAAAPDTFFVAVDVADLATLAKSVEMDCLERDVSLVAALIERSVRPAGGTLIHDCGATWLAESSLENASAVPSKPQLCAGWIAAFQTAAEALAWERALQLLVSTLPFSGTLISHPLSRDIHRRAGSKAAADAEGLEPWVLPPVPAASSSFDDLSMADSMRSPAFLLLQAQRAAYQQCESTFNLTLSTVVSITTGQQRAPPGTAQPSQSRDPSPNARNEVGESDAPLSASAARTQAIAAMKRHVLRGLRLKTALHATNIRADAVTFRRVVFNVPLVTSAALAAFAIPGTCAVSRPFFQSTSATLPAHSAAQAASPPTKGIDPPGAARAASPPASPLADRGVAKFYDFIPVTCPPALGIITRSSGFLNSVDVDYVYVASWDRARLTFAGAQLAGRGVACSGVACPLRSVHDLSCLVASAAGRLFLDEMCEGDATSAAEKRPSRTGRGSVVDGSNLLPRAPPGFEASFGTVSVASRSCDTVDLADALSAIASTSGGSALASVASGVHSSGAIAQSRSGRAAGRRASRAGPLEMPAAGAPPVISSTHAAAVATVEMGSQCNDGLRLEDASESTMARAVAAALASEKSAVVTACLALVADTAAYALGDAVGPAGGSPGAPAAATFDNTAYLPKLQGGIGIPLLYQQPSITGGWGNDHGISSSAAGGATSSPSARRSHPLAVRLSALAAAFDESVTALSMPLRRPSLAPGAMSGLTAISLPSASTVVLPPGSERSLRASLETLNLSQFALGAAAAATLMAMQRSTLAGLPTQAPMASSHFATSVGGGGVASSSVQPAVTLSSGAITTREMSGLLLETFARRGKASGRVCSALQTLATTTGAAAAPTQRRPSTVSSRGGGEVVVAPGQPESSQPPTTAGVVFRSPPTTEIAANFTAFAAPDGPPVAATQAPTRASSRPQVTLVG